MEKGFFGEFGGQYVPDDVKVVLDEIAEAYEKCKVDDNFKNDMKYYFENYIGRPSMLYEARRLSKKLGGAKIYLKREDLNHTGAHKLNNCIGQALLAKYMGKTKLVAETGAGSHGTAAATVAALFDMECKIFMGREDIKRQSLNVERMRMLGAEVISVESGTATLKEAVDEALAYWVQNKEDVFYMLGSAVGPHPYPTLVRDFQSVIGIEARAQILEKEKCLPTAIFACIGGGSNAIGLFNAFLEDKAVKIYGVEAGGKGAATEETAATITSGSVGIIHGFKSYVLQDEQGNVREAYSLSAGLDYPGVGPQLAYLNSIGRVTFHAINDDEAVEAVKLLCQTEGIMPALESAHAIAEAVKIVPTMSKEDIVIINLSGRGDKDVNLLMNI